MNFCSPWHGSNMVFNFFISIFASCTAIASLSLDITLHKDETMLPDNEIPECNLLS